MSDNDSAIKTEPQSPAISRDDFFAALYSGVKPELLLELRCIRPDTKQTRVLWIPAGDQEQLTATLHRADAMNKSGYGVFFAPCLRREKKGSAESAALAPALWVDIDCDDDPKQRTSALEKLHMFEPPPSVIVDSGGGWHSYWLLDQPFMLMDDAGREQIANILQGLFAAVGGDTDYARSVASLMRVPGSVNTKPERGGVVAVITEFHPERRYPLAAFAWLAIKNNDSNDKPQIGQSGNGHVKSRLILCHSSAAKLCHPILHQINQPPAQNEYQRTRSS